MNRPTLGCGPLELGGVDSCRLMRIIEGPGQAFTGLGQERYMELCVRDDAPW